MKTRTMTFLLTLLCSSSLFPQSAAPLLKESFRQKAAAAVTAGSYPSLVLGVVACRSVRSTTVRNEVPDADTVYEIGSVTKTYPKYLKFRESKTGHGRGRVERHAIPSAWQLEPKAEQERTE